jgi:hypothetical protein
MFSYHPYPVTGETVWVFTHTLPTAEDDLNFLTHLSNDPIVVTIQLLSLFHCCNNPNAFVMEQAMGK